MRAIRLATVAAFVAAAGAMAQDAPTPPHRPAGLGSERGGASAEGGVSTGLNPPLPAGPKPATAQQSQAAGDAKAEAPAAPAVSSGQACLSEITAQGIEASAADAPKGEAACVVDTPVRLKSIATRDGRVALRGEPLVACATARAVGRYVRDIAAPLAKGATGVALTGVVASGFECRPRNGVAGAKLSAHGLGEAVDVTAFDFADGSTTRVAEPGEAERVAFLDGARKAACGYFTTVLGPGSDAAHASHLHLDVEAHGTSGYARICQ